ncbi:WG repeat-containing protein [Mesorhizobium sp. WSM3868]|uniref:WG repeat-containing protein n=1 Tax=Mesorhizobium sp. WSM3868 TaxID=2029405 RepID=UPI000BAED30D|nr:WG repeat-containing protein [Mesorhizobium sp. WSM3868]PBB37631.1 hypothetical protein CK221_09965 [Mesorhizobium sp. WSM3868]
MVTFQSHQELWPLRSKSNGKTGYIDRNGDWAIKPTFDKATYFHSCRAGALLGDRWGVLNKQGDWLAAPRATNALNTYGEGPVRAQVAGKWGLIDDAGNWIIKPQFSSMSWFSSGLCSVILEGRYGCVNFAGNWVIPPVYGMIGAFYGGEAIAKLSNGLFGCLDASGSWNVPPAFRSLSVRDPVSGLAAAGVMTDTRGYLEGYIDQDAKWAIEPKFHRAGRFSEGFACAQRGDPGDDIILEHERWGFIDSTGAWIIEPGFQGALQCSAGVAPVEYHDRFGFLNMQGVWVFEPVLDVAWPLFNGLAEAKLNGKYGFLDRSMNWIIKPIYDKAEDFGDLIRVELGGHEMYIDRLGSNLNGSAA